MTLTVRFSAVGKRRGGRGLFALAFGLVSLALCTGAAEAQLLISRYTVHMEGVRVGHAIVRTTLGPANYKVTVSADVGPVLSNTRINGEATGLRNGSHVTPMRFQFASSGGEASSVNFAGPDGTPASVNPRLRGVFDPLSALVFAALNPAPPSAEPCKSLIPIILGRARFDIVMSPKPGGTDPRSEIIDCDAYSTVSTPDASGGIGAQNARWQIGFSKVARPALWLVEYLVVPTSNGTMTISREETNISAS
ncbi:DUF3108 domain-containing protein [Rhodomicrobium vannielii ATCC 17100]|uniref:DUF3108 domain-containing protein n=1 Tax=Rhodomicrobium vannielii TaxID=1069 RepID=UPI001917D605|nr:DUF3108 domain-containing protein [Rhodomicrobium vannielii]MBJ7534536.1 DUF3108 domain-containing protein [Rhodomicrobium vannielii ATCC 17100]